jgi:hypothetical protein
VFFDPLVEHVASTGQRCPKYPSINAAYAGAGRLPVLGVCLACSVLAHRASAKSISIMPFFLTMPISRMMPMIALTLRSARTAISSRSAPMPAEGNVERIVIG